MISQFNGKVILFDSPDDYSFYFPDYTLVTSVKTLNLFDNPTRLLIKARDPLLQPLIQQAESVIYLLGNPDYDLTTREGLISFVYDKQGKKPSQKLIENYMTYTDEEFNYYCKVYWVCGKWLGDSDNYTFFFDLLNTLQSAPVRAFTDLVTYLFNNPLEEASTLSYRWISFLSQMHSLNPASISKDTHQSANYMRTQLKIKNILAKYYKSAVQSYSVSKINHPTLRTLKLYMDSFGV